MYRLACAWTSWSAACLFLVGTLAAGLAARAAEQRWTEAKAWGWYKERHWIAGFNFIPSTAANTTEFWAQDTFDARTIDRELGWAEALGFNSCRVFVQYLVWKHDPEGLKRRLEEFLRVANGHKFSTAFVLFDDCSFGSPPQTEPYLGKQREPIPGMILPSWTPSPGLKSVTDTNAWPDLRAYVKDVIGRFAHDQRVLMWDLYNEPGNSGMGNRSLPLVEATFAWAREVGPAQPLTIGCWGAPPEISRRQLELSDLVTFHFYGDFQGLRSQIERCRGHGRPVINTEWMARLAGSSWERDLPLYKEEGVGCYSWGLVNGRTQAHFSWASQRGAPEPKTWFHDLFHADGKPYDPGEHAAIRSTTADKVLDWDEISARVDGRPRMYFGDATRNGRPFAKDPCVIRWAGRYLLYYSMAPSTNEGSPRGWGIGIAESRNLKSWKKVGEILPEQACEQNGLVNGKALVLNGQVHLFYNTYGNGARDALAHAVSADGLTFKRHLRNPILRAAGGWNSGRAIDCDAFEHEGKIHLIYATRDPGMKKQMLALAVADARSDFGPEAWRRVGDGPILQPELPWEKNCIEAPSVIKRGETFYLFYGGGYNNDPQQIGLATSGDGLGWTRLCGQPLIPNGGPGDWNSSETGHPGVFQDQTARTLLFVQGNQDRGRTWYLSAYELGWSRRGPVVIWDSAAFPMKHPGPAPHWENGISYSSGWTCWTGAGPKGGGLHYNNSAAGSAAIQFEGSQLILVHKVGPDCGIARITVDGKPATCAELDTYAEDVDWNRRTVVAKDLPQGTHTAVIQVTRRKHQASSDTYIQIVDFD